jgi:hypothetical protein
LIQTVIPAVGTTDSSSVDKISKVLGRSLVVAGWPVVIAGVVVVEPTVVCSAEVESKLTVASLQTFYIIASNETLHVTVPTQHVDLLL